MLTQRQELILKQTIEEYIRAAQPVSSFKLSKKYFPKLSPATIRNEFAQLEGQGLLTHPYTSAGRVPTDRGYQYFVKHLLEIRQPEAAVRRRVRLTAQDPWRLTRLLAERSQALVIYFEKGTPKAQQGFREVLSQPEFEDRQLMLEFLDLVSRLCRRPNLLIRPIHDHTSRVLIGRQIDFSHKKYRGFSLLVSHFQSPDDDVIVSLAGPSRMPYDENLGILEYIESLWFKN